MESNNKKWLPPAAALDSFLDGVSISRTLASLLWNRGFRTEEEVGSFLNPSYEGIPDPFLMRDMDKAVSRIRAAAANNEKIIVYGDYDIDGITSSAILLDVLSALGAKTDSYIPSRFEEGYGLNKAAIHQLADEGAKVVITVDSGIVAFEEADEAASLGLDLIITDHHTPADELPQAFAILHPKIPGEKYPEKDLSGAGVAWKLASALILKSVEENEGIFVEGEEKWLLDLAALGTISDVVPLLNENRLIAHFGLIVLRKTKRIGLRALAEAAGLDISKVTSFDVGFILGPRLNAAGRLEHAKLSLELLTTADAKRAREIALKLNDLNSKRQELTKRIYLEAKQAALRDSVDSPIIFLKARGWSHGIVGIVASRLSEEFGKPAFIAEEMESGTKGSARAGDGFDLVALMKTAHKLWERYGGHKFAAGFTYKTANYSKIKKALESAAKGHKKAEVTVRTDGVLPLTDLSEELFYDLMKLEPYGEKNPKPLFLIRGELWAKRKVGDGSHLKVTLKEGGKFTSLVAFGNGHLYETLEEKKPVETIASVELNTWNGTRSIELKAKEVRMSGFEG